MPAASGIQGIVDSANMPFRNPGQLRRPKGPKTVDPVRGQA